MLEAVIGHGFEHETPAVLVDKFGYCAGDRRVGRIAFALVDLRVDGMPPPRPELNREATAKAFQRALPKIGLKLEPAMGAGTFLVIDHIERPTEN